MQKSSVNKRFIKLIILLLLGICSVFLQSNRGSFGLKPLPQSTSSDLTDLDTFKKAFDNQQSNIQVKQTGRIAKVFRDDDHGLKHQRFLVQLDSGQKILIAHNIDLAAKVEGLKEGGVISFSGEYEWNNKGGVVHWTHRDPRGHHPNGWLLYNNRRYD
jgi:Protein of unknown function (DUF3465)